MVIYFQVFENLVEVEDYLGKLLVVLEVFFKFLNYMREKVMEMLEEDDIYVINNKDNIEWIVIVLVIWEEIVK